MMLARDIYNLDLHLLTWQRFHSKLQKPPFPRASASTWHKAVKTCRASRLCVRDTHWWKHWDVKNRHWSSILDWAGQWVTRMKGKQSLEIQVFTQKPSILEVWISALWNWGRDVSAIAFFIMISNNSQWYQKTLNSNFNIIWISSPKPKDDLINKTVVSHKGWRINFRN